MRLVSIVLFVSIVLAPDLGHCQPTGVTAGPAKLFRDVAPSVVTIKVDSSSASRQGSGVAVGSSFDDKQKILGTWFATNAHVVEGNRSDVTINEGGRAWRAKIEYQDGASDLALLHVPGLVLPVLKPYGAKSLEVGGRVFAIGSPLGLNRSLSEGLVSGIRTDGRVALLQTTAAISPGSSGGALIDEHGRLIGITTFKLREGEALNFAVDALRVEEIQSAIKAASLFIAGYERKAVRVGSEEEKDILYIESDALIKWMLETRRPDGSPTHKWFSNRLLASLQTTTQFWGGHPEFEALQAEFLATRPRGTRIQAKDNTLGMVRLTCKMNATHDGSYQFDLNVVFEPDRGTVNGIPARVTTDEIVFSTGKDAKYTATINDSLCSPESGTMSGQIF